MRAFFIAVFVACAIIARVRKVLFPTFAFLMVACGGNGGGAQSPTADNSPEQINKTKCGSCHAPWDPGSIERDKVVIALKTHKTEGRAHLSDEDWAKMTDYLSKK